MTQARDDKEFFGNNCSNGLNREVEERGAQLKMHNKRNAVVFPPRVAVAPGLETNTPIRIALKATKGMRKVVGSAIGNNPNQKPGRAIRTFPVRPSLRFVYDFFANARTYPTRSFTWSAVNVL
jgi:hypothetical protein